MALPTFTYSGVSYGSQPAGTTTFALTTSGGKAINYLLPSHIHVYSTTDNGTTLTELTRPAQWAFNQAGTAVVLTTGIAAGTAIVLRRITSSDGPYTTFGQGTLLTADQLNDSTLFNLYTSQETEDSALQSAAAAATATSTSTAASAAAASATSTANAASASAAAATSAANAATSAANASTAASSQALSNSQTALTQSGQAVSTANTASSNASSAVTTANSAAASAATALSNSQTALTQSSNAVTTANQSSTTAGTALSNSQTALTQSGQAVSTANTSATNAATALSNSQTALTQSSNAVTTANNATTTANNAAAAVSNAVLFTLVNNVAAIPASPANNTYIEVGDSTGIGSFTPLVGLPGGFVGDPGLTVRLRYTTAGSTWNYLSYFANNPETRYIGPNGGTLIGNLRLDGQAATRFADADSSNWIALRAPAVVASNVTFSLPASDGTNGQFLVTDGSGSLGWGTPNPGVILVDGGNFDNGSSFVNTAQTIDGGSF